MVSALWKACSENDLEKVHELLAGPSSVDIEIKDHTGATPLIVAVKNGHVEIIKALLDRGADPHNASSEGSPHHFTSDPAILHLLNGAQNTMSQPDIQMPAQQQQQQQDPTYGHVDPNMQYWAPPPPGMYGYYPGMHAGPPPPGPDGAMPYYVPPPMPQLPAELMNVGHGNLPPPDVARMIPCRFYPACRYGATCLFAHPQSPAAYYPGGQLPQPTHYPPYDPMSPPAFSPGYYPVSSPSFHHGQPSGAPMAHISPSGQPDGQSPGAQMAQGHPPPEMMSPPVPSPYSPSGVPPPGAYAPPPQMSPTYPPLPVAHPAAPMQHPQQSAPEAYPAPSGMPIPAPAPPFVAQPPPPPQAMPIPVEHGAPVKSPPAHVLQDGFNSTGPPRDGGMGHHRRGGVRRPSFGTSRKPPCIFFPSGRCKNGDECRFPHIMPDGTGPHHPHSPHFGGRGGHRSRFSTSQGPHANDMGTIEEKFGNLAVDPSLPPRPQNGNAGPHNGVDPNGRPRQSPNFRGGANGFAGARADHNKRAGAPAPLAMKQRLPRADEFPVLAGSAGASPARSPTLNGGPTAAQVLQAPPPTKKEALREAAPSPTVNGNGHAHVNGDVEVASPVVSNGKENTPALAPTVNGFNHAAPAPKLPVSFAAVANGAVNGVETSKEVSVSA